jgi:hypothetical protein
VAPVSRLASAADRGMAGMAGMAGIIGTIKNSDRGYSEIAVTPGSAECGGAAFKVRSLRKTG